LRRLGQFSRTHRFAEPAYHRLSGRQAAYKGKKAKAAAHWRRGLTAATRMGMAHEERLLRERLAPTRLVRGLV